MKIALGFLAGCIIILYSVYFIRIIRGQPENFEQELLNSLANWMIEKGSKSQLHVWAMFLLSLVFELSFFLAVFLSIDNLLMAVFTISFATFEMFHLFILGFSFRRFFQGRKVLKELFNWKLERSSAILFFTYSLLLIINLWWL